MHVISDNASFSKRLRSLKESSGLSWRDISVRSGVSFNSINDYANKGKVPSAVAFFKIAGALGVSCDQFATITEDKNGRHPKKR